MVYFDLNDLSVTSSSYNEKHINVKNNNFLFSSIKDRIKFFEELIEKL